MQGYLCLPYMALQQHHLLSDVAVRGFVAGATNILFRQQRHLSDAIVDVSPRKTAAEETTRNDCSLVLMNDDMNLYISARSAYVMTFEITYDLELHFKLWLLSSSFHFIHNATCLS